MISELLVLSIMIDLVGGVAFAHALAAYSKYRFDKKMKKHIIKLPTKYNLSGIEGLEHDLYAVPDYDNLMAFKICMSRFDMRTTEKDTK